jgi:hypothetical protein
VSKHLKEHLEVTAEHCSKMAGLHRKMATAVGEKSEEGKIHTAMGDACAVHAAHCQTKLEEVAGAIDTSGHSDDIGTDMGDNLGPKASIIIDPKERDAALIKAGRDRWGVSGLNVEPGAGLRAIPRAGSPSMEADADTEAIDQLARRRA